MAYYCYILYSPTVDKFYIGATANLEERLRKHNSGHKGFTGRAKDWRVEHYEEFVSKKAAMARERQLKGWKSRTRIEALLGSGHPG